MARPLITSLSLCTGVGMLDEGVGIGLDRLGFDHRVVGYVERDAYAATILLDRMEEAALEPAPIWCGNIEDMDATAFCGVDLVTAGFPCQPHSAAGKRESTEDERWIWPAIAEVIRTAEPGRVFLENVRGLLSSGHGAAVREVFRDLARLGFDARWCVLRASEVGADHERERVFILAESTRIGRGEGRSEPGGIEGRLDAAVRGVQVGNAGHRATGNGVNGKRLASAKGGSRRNQKTGRGSGELGNAASIGRRAQSDGGEQVRGPDSGNHLLGDPHGVGPRRERLSRWGAVGRTEAGGSSLPVFAPGPGLGGFRVVDRLVDLLEKDPDRAWRTYQAELGNTLQWAEILDERPWLSPAVEPGFCVLVDGVACSVDASRADQLRCIGNGVVPQQAAWAFETLWRANS